MCLLMAERERERENTSFIVEQAATTFGVCWRLKSLTNRKRQTPHSPIFHTPTNDLFATAQTAKIGIANQDASWLVG